MARIGLQGGRVRQTCWVVNAGSELVETQERAMLALKTRNGRSHGKELLGEGGRVAQQDIQNKNTRARPQHGDGLVQST